MNTGVQRSGATPPAARTATTEAVGPQPGNRFGIGKDLPRHRDGTRHPLRRHRHRRRTARPRGQGRAGRCRCAARATCTSSCPCPLGWGSAPADTVKLARLAQRSGLFPVFEAEHGDGHGASLPIRDRVPVEEYLRPQQRYAHLFGDRAAPRRHRRACSSIADRNIARYGLLAEDERLMNKPFAITLDVAVQPGQPHRHAGAASVRSTSTGCRRATTPARPASRCRRWLYAAEDGGYETAWRRLVDDNPFPAIMGRVCYHPCETACNRAQLDTAVGINSVERFLGDEAISAGLAAARHRPRRPASECWSSAPGRPGCPPPTTCAALGHEVEIHEAGQSGRRHDALRHPDLPPASRRPRHRDRPPARRSASRCKLDTRSTTWTRPCATAGSTPPSSRSARS